MKIIAITQARCGSTRLPNKILKTVNGQTLLNIHLDRILKSARVDQLIVATTIDVADNAIEEIAVQKGLPFYRGSVNNVLDRFYQAAKPHYPDWVIRLTSDCPLIDAGLFDKLVDKAIELDVDYCSNTLNPTYPDGMDAEVFKFSALEKAWNEATLNSDKEHVTPYIHKNSSFNNKDLFKSYNYANDANYGNVRLTVDEQADFDVIKLLIEKLGTDQSWETYAEYCLHNDEMQAINRKIKRNEGYMKSVAKD
jgi:spore coat polysaccharide biosynthesis protein SpsF